jgi:succinate dehydrogenase / fumarate reductase cytochrome b subunit
MNAILAAANSTVGRKWTMGLSGLLLVGFAANHLAGNLSLFANDHGASFNAYTEFLHSFGPLLKVAEVGLAALFLLHIGTGIMVTRSNREARPVGYSVTADAGGASRKQWASLNMIVSGMILLGFLVVHLLSLRFGDNFSITESGLVKFPEYEGMNPEARDLATLTVTKFKNPLYVGFYTGTVALLFFHLRHGFWSAFQSMGASNPKAEPIIRLSGVAIAAALTAGFLVLPIWIFLDPMGIYTELVR